MHCRTCGKEVDAHQSYCNACGVPPLAGNAFCQECGAATNPKAIVCVNCGVALARPVSEGFNLGFDELVYPSNPPKDPLLMAVLSGCCLAPGLGQIVLGQTWKGIAMFLLTAATMWAGYIPIAPIAAVDAYLIAKKLRDGTPVGKWEFF